MSQPTVLTHSMLTAFRNCRKACEWRYIENLLPIRTDPALSFGSLIHECLELWHRERKLTEVLDHIARVYPGGGSNDRERHMAEAMMRGYAQRYPTETFEVVALERVFEGPIVNPTTGIASPDFLIAGKIDGIVRVGDEYHILEHKTTSRLDGGYLERLWINSQIVRYTHCARELLGIPVAGVIYNILVKPRLRQGTNETDAAFVARLATKCAEPGMYHREKLYISEADIHTLRKELWDVAEAFWTARHRRAFFRNTDHCYRYGRMCSYLPLCRAGDSAALASSLYQVAAPHEELRATSAPSHGELATTREVL